MLNCSYYYYGKTKAWRSHVKDTQVLHIMEKLFLRSVKVLSLTFVQLGFEGEHLISDLQSQMFQVWTCGISGTVQGR